MNIKIFTIHKTKEKWLKMALAEYEKRLTKDIKFDWHISKDEKDLEKKVLKENFYICLDEKAKILTSIDFSKKIFNFFENHKSKISFVIGSDIGLSKKIKTKANYAISLSKLTFTHQMVRLILLEQLYRAFQISKNTKYHK
ncbi:MAG: Ribosomal RNA large subunit methyltransferase H [Candidatus Anoxychlamydiales bacterium]|nr:Ribosomal RNA large subunit methyltransferase H [Candidatus Anoxychlamydiales bacterium]NGX40547.1 Ribosomal RNA large subunit methyltransferase H [Candidatus Anoxychlamydiales bacterium]HEU63817.1 23S rRNA (pseudouridine(1915)-N(3))-methyltransferase RlmH [Chlamydiota bacterium]